MSQLLPSQEGEKRRNNKKKKVGEKERWRFCFGLAHSFYLFFFLNESIFISFRCSFCTQVHLTCGLLIYFLLVFLFFCFFFLRKSWWFVLTKMEILFWFQLIYFIFFFYLMKLYFSHLDVASANGFILHVDYYFLSCWFFF